LYLDTPKPYPWLGVSRYTVRQGAARHPTTSNLLVECVSFRHVVISTASEQTKHTIRGVAME
jgi:hypothetical protein